MEYFDRYTTDLKYMNAAFSRYSPFRLNLSDYDVTEEECIQYWQKLKEAQKMNQEKLKDDERRYNILTICVSIILFHISILIIYFFNLPFIISWIILVGPLGCVYYIYNEHYKEKHYRQIIYKDLFPPINNKIENLFNDYLKEESKRYEIKKK